MNDQRDVDRNMDTAIERSEDGEPDFIDALVGDARAVARAAEAERRADELAVVSDRGIKAHPPKSGADAD